MPTLTTNSRSVLEVMADERVRAELVALVGMSWVHPEPLLTDAMTHVDSMLLGRDEAGRLVGFMTWRLQRLTLSTGRTLAAVYAGLGAVDAAWQGQGLGKHVIYGGIEAGIAELARHPASDQTVVWTTTASPIGYLGLAKRFTKGFNPRPDGGYDDAALPVLDSLKQVLGVLPQHHDPHPFVLRGFSQKRYASTTHQALTEVTAPLFVSHRVDERNGDRLILLFDA